MSMPRDAAIVDGVLGIPSPNPPRGYDSTHPLLRDAGSLRQLDPPVECGP